MKKVKKKKEINSKTILKVIGVVLFFLLVSILYVHHRFLIINLGYKITERINEEERLLRERENLRKELYLLKSPFRIEREAKRMGMEYPREWQIKIIKIRKDGS